MKTLFWSVVIFSYILTGAIIYMQGSIPEFAGQNDLLTIFRILFTWPLYFIPGSPYEIR